jgi:hypothetical protein
VAAADRAVLDAAVEERGNVFGGGARAVRKRVPEGNEPGL